MKRLLSSDLVSLRSGLPSEMQLTTKSMHSSRDMCVKRLSTSKDTINLPNIDKDWMPCTKVKVSIAQCSVGMCGDKRLQRYLAKL